MSTTALSQRGGIITGWLLRLVIGLALLGVVVFEFGAVVIARVGVDGTAQTAAREAALVYGSSQNVETAKAEAAKKAKEGGATLSSFEVSQDGTTVTVTLERKARTFLIHKIGALKKYATVRATDTTDVR